MSLSKAKNGRGCRGPKLRCIASLVACLAGGASGGAAAPDVAPGPAAGGEILHYLDPERTDLVRVNKGRVHGLSAGALFSAERAVPGNPGAFVETGQLKIETLGETSSLARVLIQGSELSHMVFPRFPEMMAGDQVRQRYFHFYPRNQVVPETVLEYPALFADPGSEPASYELSEEGSQTLVAAVQYFSTKRITNLLVMGHTDSVGNSEVDQVESYQRALTVRQYLVDQLGFAPTRVVALGLGETEPADETQVAGAARRNRRIVLKLLP